MPYLALTMDSFALRNPHLLFTVYEESSNRKSIFLVEGFTCSMLWKAFNYSSETKLDLDVSHGPLAGVYFQLEYSNQFTPTAQTTYNLTATPDELTEIRLVEVSAQENTLAASSIAKINAYFK